MLLTAKTKPESPGDSRNRLDLNTHYKSYDNIFLKQKNKQKDKAMESKKTFFLCVIYLCNKAFQRWKC